jgi:hypothetical protein
MGFDPARIEVRRGEQVRFVLQNNGEEDHEFVLAVLAPWFTGPVGFVLAAPRALPFRPLRGALGFFEPASGSPIGCALSLEAVALFVRPAPMVAETTGTPHVHRRWR